MSLMKTKPLADCETPWAALRELASGFRDAGAVRQDMVETPGHLLPEPYRTLLCHREHMTHALHRHHGRPVDLYVMEHHRDGDLYGRKIFLTRANTAWTVELGLVRLDLRYVRPPVRREILEGRTPLGAVLTNHNVLRRIEPRWFLRFPAGSSVLAWFGARGEGETYGRLGTIYCDGEPAVEVLEIITGV